MAVHGSMARDADLICVPWTDEAEDPQAVVDDITSQFVIRTVGEPSVREHGRIIYTLTIAAPGCFIDLSFTPRGSALLPSEPAEKAGVVGWRDIENDPPPHDVPVLLWSPPSLGWPNGQIEARPFSTGRSGPGWSEYSQHSWATKWMPLPASPSPATGEA